MLAFQGVYHRTDKAFTLSYRRPTATAGDLRKSVLSNDASTASYRLLGGEGGVPVNHHSVGLPAFFFGLKAKANSETRPAALHQTIIQNSRLMAEFSSHSPTQRFEQFLFERIPDLTNPRSRGSAKWSRFDPRAQENAHPVKRPS